MANTAEEAYTAGHFGWSIPHISTVFQNKSNIWLSPTCTCCGAEWRFIFMRRRHSVHIQLSRRVKKHGHRNNAICEFIKIASDGAEQDFGEPVCNLFEEVMNSHSATTEYKFLFNVPMDIGARITCLIECYDCKSVTPALLPKGSGSLGRDLMELLTSGEDSDVTISVEDREFKVHKCIIRARSPVFYSMLKHDMVEKRTGNVDIPDCEPEVFQKFLEYVYSGELKELSNDIVCSLYNIADKYQVFELKEGCVEFMLKNLSLESFCDFAALSVLHNELELLEAAEKFFVKNSKAIVEIDGWHNCMRENPIAANYFLEKLLRPEVYNEKKRKQWNPEEKKKKSQAVCSSLAISCDNVLCNCTLRSLRSKIPPEELM